MSLALLRNWLTSALRDMRASPLQSAIAIGSLAIGLWAAILAGLIADNQASYDDFIPGAHQIYTAIFHTGGLGGISEGTPHDLAAHLKSFPQVRAVTRFAMGRGTFSNGDAIAREDFYWADPDFFRLMPLPVLHGDLSAAMTRPDGLVLSRAMARKYFGRDDPLGQTLLLNHKTALTVRAVIADLTAHASNLERGIFIAAASPLSSMTLSAVRTGVGPGGGLSLGVRTLVRLSDDAAARALGDEATALIARLRRPSPGAPAFAGTSGSPGKWAVSFSRLDEIPLSPLLNPANRERLTIFAAMAALVLLLACLNFISLSLARSTRRAAEVGIRKVAGAGHGALMAQFLGEAVLQALAALGAAMALVEWTLPLANSLLQSGAVFAWWHDPLLMLTLVGGAALVGTAAGLYPAFVLSAFRPASVLKGLMLRGSAWGARLRQGLVTLQFAIPLVLIIATAVVFLQNRFAATQALRLDTDRMLMVNLPACGTTFEAEIAALPGVAAAACSGPSLFPNLMFIGDATARNGRNVSLMLGEVGFGFFQLYHLPALAGRLPDPGHPGDAVPVRQANAVLSGPLPTIRPPGPRPPRPPIRYVINEAAVTAFGFASANDAIGKRLPLDGGNNGDTIIGVVRDFSLYPPLQRIQPTAYKTAMDTGGGLRDPGMDAAALHVRLKGGDIAETLTAVDAVWQRHSQDPINRIFLNDYVQESQIAVLRQGQAFALFAVVAVMLACLGLFGLSLSAVERRTKEIGVRKAMGAGNGDVLRLLLWQFSQPVLLANLIAWPAAWWLMRRWLAEFPYHISLHWWLFAAASGLTLLIALVTVAGHALAAARTKPVHALRYE